MYQKAKVEASEKEHIAAPASTMLADAWIRLKKNKAAVVALFILIGIILLAIFAPIFSKYSFRDTDYNNVYGLPSAAHIFGADQFGRDLWVRTWMGTRISLMIALVAAILDLVVGLLFYLEDLLGAFHVEFPDLSKLPVIPCADKQGSAQFCLQFQQLLVQGGLGQI